jgi:hypothetical protein
MMSARHPFNPLDVGARNVCVSTASRRHPSGRRDLDHGGVLRRRADVAGIGQPLSGAAHPNVDTDRAHMIAETLRRLAKRHGGSLAVLEWTHGAQPLHPAGAQKHHPQMVNAERIRLRCR